MGRLPPLAPESLSSRQQEVYAAIAAGPRGSVRGPFPAWIRSPELADRGQKLGEFCRFHTGFEPRLAELAILMCARFWTAQYEWFAHARLAREAGLSDAIIDAIARRERPEMATDEAAVHDFCQELHRDHTVSDATYRRVLDRFGERGAVELIGISGYYTMVSMTLNVAEVALPPGEAGLEP